MNKLDYIEADWKYRCQHSDLCRERDLRSHSLVAFFSYLTMTLLWVAFHG